MDNYKLKIKKKDLKQIADAFREFNDYMYKDKSLNGQTKTIVNKIKKLIYSALYIEPDLRRKISNTDYQYYVECQFYQLLWDINRASLNKRFIDNKYNPGVKQLDYFSYFCTCLKTLGIEVK